MKILFHTGCTAYRNALKTVAPIVLSHIKDVIPLCQLREHVVKISGNALLDSSMVSVGGGWRQLCSSSLESENKLFLRNKGHVDYVKRLRESFDFDIVVLWGDYFENRDIRQYLKEENIPCMSLELACMRSPFPEAVFVDPQGANGESSLKHHMDTLFEHKMFKQMENIHILDLFDHKCDKKGEILESYYNGGDVDLFTRHYMKGAGYILCPLQSSDDANIIYNSPFTSMSDYLFQLGAIADKSDYKFIVTPHPSYKTKPVSFVYQDYVTAQNIVQQHPNMVWCDELDTFSLVDQAQAVLSINSSSGFEAMMMNKITFVTGSSCFLADVEVSQLESSMFSRLSDPDWRKQRLYKQNKYVKAVFAALIHNRKDGYANFLVDAMELLCLYPNPENHYKEYWTKQFNHLFKTWV